MRIPRGTAKGLCVPVLNFVVFSLFDRKLWEALQLFFLQFQNHVVPEVLCTLLHHKAILLWWDIVRCVNCKPPLLGIQVDVNHVEHPPHCNGPILEG